MNSNFKATHIVVATSPLVQPIFGFRAGTEVILSEDGNLWLTEKGWTLSKQWDMVEPIKPASLFTEAQLRELEGIYGLKRVESDSVAVEVVASVTAPTKSYYVLSRGEQPVGLFFTSEDATIAAEDVCDPYLDVFDDKGLHFGTMKMICGQWSQEF